jgi:poly(beta-D-mannuronate) lyase
LSNVSNVWKLSVSVQSAWIRSMNLKNLSVQNLAWTALSVAFLTSPLCGLATTHTARSSIEVTALCGSVQPGDTIVLEDGIYTDQQFVLTGQGTAEKPITLRAETPGKAVLTGASTLSISGTSLIVDGLLFKDGALESGSVIKFEDSSQHCVLRNCAVIDYNPADIETRYFWITLNGVSNIVEHCTFSGQTHSGVTLCVRLDGKPAGHIIRRNHFAGRPEGNGNGFETIRIGTGGQLTTDARCTVTENLFEKCDGEIEIISNKSCENVYTSNTFLRSVGCLTIRQGNRCRVENNLFIGDNVEGARGLRLTGKDHRIANNYFSGLQNAIAFQSGVLGDPKGGYAQVQNCLMDGNTFVDNPGPLFTLDAGYSLEKRPLLPEEVTISNSLMVIPEDAAPMIESRNPQTGITWENNSVVSDKIEFDLPAGFQSSSGVPTDLKERLTFCPLTKSDVGAEWMRGSL